MTKYIFEPGKPLRIHNAKSANAQVIGEALAQLKKDCGSGLKAEKVVDAARNPSHPLHKHFEWNDAKATVAYRLGQARDLIRIVREDHTDFANPVRSFVSIHEDSGTSYRTINEIRESVDLQAKVLKQAESDLAAWEHRYQELVDICDIVRSARAKLADEMVKHDKDRRNRGKEARPQA